MTSERNWIYYGCIGARMSVALTLILLAFGNYLRFEEFSTYVESQTFVPWSVRRLLPVLVPFTAVVLAMGLVFDRHRRRWVVLTCGALALSAGCLINAVVNPWDPQCNCASLIRRAAEIRHENVMCLAIGVLLLGLASVAFFEDTCAKKSTRGDESQVSRTFSDKTS